MQDIEVNVEKLWEVEERIINHGSGNAQEKIHEELKNRFIDKLQDINVIGENQEDRKDEHIKGIKGCVEYIYSEEFMTDIFGSTKTKDNVVKKNYTITDIYNWLLDDYYQVNYAIKFKNRPLGALSPGQKGLVLMKIFLLLDNENKPLLIDQPEDNLDNKSVFKDLVNDFKEIKKKRQIIIATHNPNLVVNTDSEQVIVARFDDVPAKDKPRIMYTCGSLENKEIRKLVCDILEGGDQAFIKREQRYSLKFDE
ncbi:P-loop NTPase family protein [Cellulosilyticum lentocellum]|uniref:DNA repair ATPase, putative n=1 Tax=Cellulosilyticum lentocellum (strain ATCC 49066 / DSM 5427 / NCIMB 11756 / RHM5) TaxID=642492 RepID=F2JKX1_CELLD|nr:DNA repair ATPase [Cellulosilyticum lentocellum]ADZ84512.1 DNA repair ATPase, putative [Cellulosilyticum lentocellum DSM 5427]